MIENEFYPEQEFEGGYPPEAAIWCTESGKYHIEEDALNPGTFRIVENPAPPEPSYQQLRAAEYPDYREYLDAQVKINSGNETLIAEGQSQLNAYFEKCLEVKEKYPKP